MAGNCESFVVLLGGENASARAHRLPKTGHAVGEILRRMLGRGDDHEGAIEQCSDGVFDPAVVAARNGMAADILRSGEPTDRAPG